MSNLVTFILIYLMSYINLMIGMYNLTDKAYSPPKLI